MTKVEENYYFTITDGSFHIDCYSDEEAPAVDRLIDSGFFFEQLSYSPKIASVVSAAVDFLEGLNEDDMIDFRQLYNNGYRFVFGEDGAIHVYSFPMDMTDQDIDETDYIPVFIAMVNVGNPSANLEIVYEKIMSLLN